MQQSIEEKAKEEWHRYQIIKRTILCCFVLLLLVHCVDVMSTFIGLEVGAYETNPVTAYLYQFGYAGYFAGSLYIIFLFLFFFCCVDLLIRFYEILVYKKMPLSTVCTMYIVLTGILFFGIMLAVINNISVIIDIIR